jgi:hypothetical protein
MAFQDDYDEEGQGYGRYVRPAVVVVVTLCIGAAAWYGIHNTAGVRREAPPLPPMVALMPPPPPPPPKEKPPEPEKKIEEVQKPVEEPKPMDAPKPLTINGPAQAGSDSFNIGAGDGSGTVGGTGFGEANYARYMGAQFQQSIQQDDQINRLVFAADIGVWVDASGHVTRATILATSGDAKVDKVLVSDIEGLTLDEAPPLGMRFPQRIRVRGHRLAS